MRYGDKIKVSNLSISILLLFLVVMIGLNGESNAQAPSESTVIAEGNQLIVNDKMNTVVIIGASYVRAWPIQELGGKQVINKGVDGQQSFEMLQRFEQDVVAINPRSVIIWGFINDIHRTPRVALLRSSRTYCIISQFLADPVSFNV